MAQDISLAFSGSTAHTNFAKNDIIAAQATFETADQVGTNNFMQTLRISTYEPFPNCNSQVNQAVSKRLG
jgi:hypothetical protein